jgi:hypothetical protein
LGVAVVLFYSLRNSALAVAPPPTRSTVTMREALRVRAYRSALLSNFCDGLVGVWAAHRAGPAVHLRRDGRQRRRHRLGARGVRGW